MSVTRIIYVALALLVAGAVWFFRETGDPSATELLAARKDVLRQIENAERVVGRRDGNSGLRRQNLNDLHAILEEIETELRELEPDAAGLRSGGQGP